MTHTPTDETTVDVARPSVHRYVASGESVPRATLPDELDDDDTETMLLSRLGWPEPPRSLSERPRHGERLVVPQLSRSVGGISRSVFIPGGVQQPAFWRGLVLAVSLAAGVSLLISKMRLQGSSALEVRTSAPATLSAASAPRPPHAMPPPLFIAVGNVSGTNPAPATAKPAIDVTKLPLAPPRAPAPQRSRHPNKPAVRNKPQAPVSAAPSAAPGSTASRGSGVDDGF